MKTICLVALSSIIVHADECENFCNSRLSHSECSFGSYCKNNHDCQRLFWTDITRSEICVLGTTPGCANTHMVTCAEARDGLVVSSPPPELTSTYNIPSALPAIMTTGRPTSSMRSSDGSCTGRRWGMFTWDTSYYRRSNGQLLEFLGSSMGRQFACGDLYINVADYSSPSRIPDPDRLIAFIKAYRRVVGYDSIVYLTYGDVTERSGPAMMTFTATFFDWAESISPEDAEEMGAIGVSYDVERLDAEVSKAALLLGRERRLRTPFGEANLRIQHTLDGDVNILSTQYVMQYADSALAMLYSNTESGLVDQIRWLTTTQCPRCLDDAYAAAHFNAKVSIMVEASCRMGRGCRDKSMCIFDSPSQGAFYMAQTFDAVEALLESGSVIPVSQYDRIFDRRSLWAVHNFEWFRCYSPFDSSLHESCREYHREAASCRGQ